MDLDPGLNSWYAVSVEFERQRWLACLPPRTAEDIPRPESEDSPIVRGVRKPSLGTDQSENVGPWLCEEQCDIPKGVGCMDESGLGQKRGMEAKIRCGRHDTGLEGTAILEIVQAQNTLNYTAHRPPFCSPLRYGKRARGSSPELPIMQSGVSRELPIVLAFSSCLILRQFWYNPMVLTAEPQLLRCKLPR